MLMTNLETLPAGEYKIVLDNGETNDGQTKEIKLRVNAYGAEFVLLNRAGDEIASAGAEIWEGKFRSVSYDTEDFDKCLEATVRELGTVEEMK